MGKRKVSILEPAAEAVADIALFIEGKGMPETAKKFVDEAFEFFETFSDERIEHKSCNYNNLWKYLIYSCVTYKKYVVAYPSQQNEIIICDFIASPSLAQATLQIIKLLLAQGCRAGKVRWRPCACKVANSCLV